MSPGLSCSICSPVLRDARRHGRLFTRLGTSLTWKGAFHAYRAIAKELGTILFCRIDANSDGITFGRGTARIAGQDYAFYVVDAGRVKFVGTSFPSAFVGDAFAQQNIAFNTASVSGGFAFVLAGSGSSGSIGTAGRFTADGGGGITNVVIDENNNGSITQLPNGAVTGSYTVDNNGFGGGTLSTDGFE